MGLHTKIPDYHDESNVTKEGDNVILEFTIKQSNVSENFKNVLPIYLEYQGGKIGRLGSMGIVGTTPVKQKVSLGPMKETPIRILLNVNYDTLCTIDGN